MAPWQCNIAHCHGMSGHLQIALVFNTLRQFRGKFKIYNSDKTENWVCVKVSSVVELETPILFGDFNTLCKTLFAHSSGPFDHGCYCNHLKSFTLLYLNLFCLYPSARPTSPLPLNTNTHRHHTLQIAVPHPSSPPH